MLNSRDELLAIKAHVAARRQPWLAGFEALTKRAAEYRAWQPRPVKIYQPWPHWGQPGISRDLLADNEAVYANALLFVMTGDAAHAGKAAEIINAWAHTLERIETGRFEEVLTTSYSWPAFVWAAELIEGYDRPAFERMLRTIVVPVVRQAPWHNNWYSWGVCGRMTLALYFGDEDWFAETQQQFVEQLHHYLGWTLLGELGRDLWHAQMGLAPLIAAAEMAWHRGVDLYGAAGNLLYRGLEFQTPFFLGDAAGWPFTEPPEKQGELWPMFEMATHHYYGRCGLPCPNLRRAVARTRPEGWNRVGWGTLTHAAEI